MDEPTTVISSTNSRRMPRMDELWDYRELLWVLTTRDIKIRYKQTAIGIFWALLQPLLTTIVFTLVFGRLGRLPSDGLPYPLFVMTALLPWQLFARALAQGSSSLVTLGGVMGKIYFPKLIAPISAVFAGAVDFAIAFGILAAFMAWYGVVPTWKSLFVVVFVLLSFVTALAVSLWLSVINARFRDVQIAMPFLTQIWMFLTPVIYPSSLVPAEWKWLYGFNPMVSVIEGFRWSLLGGNAPDTVLMVISLVSITVLLVGGLFYFGRFEKTFIDRL